MVIGQLLGLPIAFGSGQLSGAGFGPNYTILMKLGYEFYAPRILDEMQKNPEKSFEDTQYWRAFQKHLKSYTDKVLLQTINSLAEFPKQTLDALSEKFGNYITGADDSTVPTTTSLTSASNLGSQLVTIRLDLGQGFRRDEPGAQKDGTSLFDRDLANKRQQEQEIILSKAEKHNIAVQKEIKKEFTKEFTAVQKTVKASETVKLDRIGSQASGKRPAGQSVRLELNKIQLEILELARTIKVNQAVRAKLLPKGNKLTPSQKAKLANATSALASQIKTMRVKQLKIEQFMRNYTFA